MPKPKKAAVLTAPEVTPGSKLVGDKRTEMAAYMKDRYEKGATIRDLNDETGRSFGAIQQLLKESGTTIRPRGGARAKV